MDKNLSRNSQLIPDRSLYIGVLFNRFKRIIHIYNWLKMTLIDFQLPIVSGNSLLGCLVTSSLMLKDFFKCIFKVIKDRV